MSRESTEIRLRAIHWSVWLFGMLNLLSTLVLLLAISDVSRR